MVVSGGPDAGNCDRRGGEPLETLGDVIWRWSTRLRHRVVMVCRRGEKDGLAERPPDRFRALPTTSSRLAGSPLPVETSRVAFPPSGAAFVPPRWD
jgi:hypothetical protein